MSPPASTGGPSRAAAPVLMAVALRPRLWVTAAAAVLRLARPGWWRHRPHLPVPDPSLWAFRMVTAYGRPDAVPSAADVVGYLEWCRTSARTHRVHMAPGPPPER